MELSERGFDLRESRRGGRRELPHPKPVEKIEISSEHGRLRLALTIIFLVVGAFFIAYGVANLSSKDAGWNEMEVASSELNCGGDFVFLYNLGAGGVSAKVENKELTAIYSDAAEYAFRMFTGDVEYEGVHNMYYVSRHPNEEMVVDEVLYEAFSLIQECGDRSLYLAPVYEQYDGLFHCAEEYQAAEYDPYGNQDVADYYAAIAGFASDERMVDLELLGENRICLRVAEEYLDFAAENEIEHFIDFYWMKNAFIIDYLADRVISAGYTRGCISSFDGFIRNLDGSGESYAYTFYDREGSTIYPMAEVRYSGPSAIVYLRDYGLESGQQYYYAYSNGEIRTPYLDARDGLCKSACSDLVCHSGGAGCSEVLMRMIPVYIADTLREDALEKLEKDGIFSIYNKDGRVCYNDEGLTLTDL